MQFKYCEISFVDLQRAEAPPLASDGCVENGQREANRAYESEKSWCKVTLVWDTWLLTRIGQRCTSRCQLVVMLLMLRLLHVPNCGHHRADSPVMEQCKAKTSLSQQHYIIITAEGGNVPIVVAFSHLTIVCVTDSVTGCLWQTRYQPVAK